MGGIERPRGGSPRDPAGQDPGLARPRPRHDRQRRGVADDRLSLLRVEADEDRVGIHNPERTEGVRHGRGWAERRTHPTGTGHKEGPRVAITPKRSGLLGARVPRTSPLTIGPAPSRGPPTLPRTGWNTPARGLGAGPGFRNSRRTVSSVTDRRPSARLPQRSGSPRGPLRSRSVMASAHGTYAAPLARSRDFFLPDVTPRLAPCHQPFASDSGVAPWAR